MIQEIDISTSSRTELIRVDEPVNRIIQESGIREGLCILWVPHTTAAITVNENADPDVVQDILKKVQDIIPFQDHYRHREGNSAAHIKSSLFGPGLTLIVHDRKALLGTWQSVFFCEFDGPRNRRLIIKVEGE